MTSLMTTVMTKAMTRVVAYVGWLVAGDDAGVDITSRSRDFVHRHVPVRTVPQQHRADSAVRRRDVHRTVRSVTGDDHTPLCHAYLLPPDQAR